jgi:hypothetical protein
VNISIDREPLAKNLLFSELHEPYFLGLGAKFRMSTLPSPPASSMSISGDEPEAERVIESADVEAQKQKGRQQPPASHWLLITDHADITPEVLKYNYRGSGSDADPYVIEFIPDDRRDPQLWSKRSKWTYTLTMAWATLAISLASSAYTGGANQIMTEVYYLFY